MWLLGHTVDAAAQGDLHQVRERLALMLVALDQSVVDGGDWTVAYLLSLAEDPPISLFQDRSSTMAPFGKPFGSLVPPQWSSVVLAYYQRNGSPGEQKAGVTQKDAKGCRSRESLTEKKSKIPEASSSRSGGRKGTVSDLHEEISPTGGNVPVAAGSETVLHAGASLPRNDLFGKHISFASWCAQMVTSVFRTRTAFSAFARSAIHLTPSFVASRSPAFPIPLPHFGVFDRMPSGLSLRQRSRVHFKRAVVLTILALDFWWSGNRFIDMSLLRRSPSASQRQIIKRVVDFMQVDGPKIPFCVSLSGRRSPQLIARLCELSDALTSAGVKSSPYDRVF